MMKSDIEKNERTETEKLKGKEKKKRSENKEKVTQHKLPQAQRSRRSSKD